MVRSRVGSEMCIRASGSVAFFGTTNQTQCVRAVAVVLAASTRPITAAIVVILGLGEIGTRGSGIWIAATSTDGSQFLGRRQDTGRYGTAAALSLIDI